MNDQQLLRYSRHILLPEIGIDGQQKLLAAHVLVVGAGGLGSPAAMYLAAAGIGTLTICDGDVVDLTNLQRQILHRTSSIGQAKVASAGQTLAELNPEVRVITIPQRVDESSLQQLVAGASLVLDCSDNFATRYALNRTCFQLAKPLISGAATRFEGQICTFDFRNLCGPCYSCLYPEQFESEDTRCAVMGVFAPLVGCIGSLQAAEAIKLLLGAGQTLTGELMVMDILKNDVRTIRLSADSSCPVCGVRKP